MCVINVISSGLKGSNCAKIKINEAPIVFNPNENGHYRGLHIAIIDLIDGNIDFSKVFDTFKSSEKLE